MRKLTIPDLIGRNHRGGGGHRGGGRSGRRREFGGYDGYGYGYPYFPYPSFPPDEIVELSPGVPVQVTRSPRPPTLLSGPGTGRGDRELADLGELIAPGSRGLTVQLALDADRRLCASICIDGEYYQGSVDLAAVLERIASGIASYHASLHPAAVPAAIADTANAADVAVDAAGDLLVGALIDQHCATVSAGWWNSLTHAVYGVHHTVAKTIQKFKEPITVAASAVASIYGGPAAGSAAAKLCGPLIDGVADDFQTKKDAKVVIDAAHEAAKTDPKVAKALADAHKAVADTAAAYHITATAADAAAGDPAAAQKVADLDKAASSGDTAAQQAMSVITQAFATAASNRADVGTTTAGLLPGMLPFTLGAAMGAGGYAWWRRYQARKAERAAAAVAAVADPAAVPPPSAVPDGFVPDGELRVNIGASIWQTPGGVQSELERINSDFVVFAAEITGYLKARGYPTTVAPALRPLVDLYENAWTPLVREWQTFFSKYRGWWDNFWWNHAPEAEQYEAQLVEVRATAKQLGMSSTVTAAAGELIGAAITTLRQAAQSAVLAAHERHGATALAYVKDAHLASVLPFPTLDDADDWFGALDPRDHLYAAYFDATDPTWPSPIHEALGGPAAAAAHSHAATQGHL